MNTTVQYSPVKDGRRILGEKDSNACLPPAPQAKQSFPVTGTPVKQMSTILSPRKLLPSPIFAGQKRTRDQVDETEENIGHVQARECSPLHVQSAAQEDMQSQVSSITHMQRNLRNDQPQANHITRRNSCNKHLTRWTSQHHKTPNPNVTRHTAKWKQTMHLPCFTPPRRKRVASPKTQTRAKCSSKKYAKQNHTQIPMDRSNNGT
jgi:hypothetical protein